MRKNVLILLLFSVNYSFCQLTEDFTDGNLSHAPTWSGSNFLADFKVEAKQLRSNSATLNNNFYLSTQNELAINCTWEFWCNLKFNTSGANYTDVYLISDQEDLRNSHINGYFIRVGGTQDEISLFRRSGSLRSAVKIIDGLDGTTRKTNTKLKIRITRDVTGTFTLDWDLTGTGLHYVPGGRITDNTFTTTAWFGIYIQQSTASFIRKHYFDDIRINPLIKDVAPPVPVKVVLVDSLHLDVYFNEAIAVADALNPENYVPGNAYDGPVTVTATALPTVFRLDFSKPFETGHHELTVKGMADLFGNRMAGNAVLHFFFIRPYVAQPGDLIVNEIFADPSPQTGLPDAEFIELWNTTSKYILLNGWKYGDQTGSYTFGTDTIGPQQYAILCPVANTASYTQYGTVLGINNWLHLNNDKDVVWLMSPEGVEIDRVAYMDTWYKDADKKQGGYSLECIDPVNMCTGIQNWTVSAALSGGTPGKQNSVYKQQQTMEKPRLTGSYLKDSVTIALTFNTYIDSASASDRYNYAINQGIGNPKVVQPQSPDFTTVLLTLDRPLKRGITYVLTITHLRNCAGNEIDPQASEATFFKAERIGRHDILISEILFNPKIGGVDFVEIYNNTDHILDLSELQLISIAETYSQKQVSDLPAYIQPATYMVLTTNPTSVQSDYLTRNTHNFIQMNMPAFKSKSGTVQLSSNNLLIDQFNYNEALHIPFLKEVKGVSLERVSFEIPAHQAGNFTSASATAGYATPTYKNSVAASGSPLQKEFYLGAKVFSPDGDGVDDFLEINYNFGHMGKMGTLKVYNAKGELQRQLIRNQSLATAGVLTWDGLNDRGRLCKVGIYVLCFDVFELNGQSRSLKQTCVLAAKLH